MKKHLRGKRYIRSRATVAIGRMKRRERRVKSFGAAIDNLVRVMSEIDWNRVGMTYKQAIEEVIRNAQDLLGYATQVLKRRLAEAERNKQSGG